VVGTYVSRMRRRESRAKWKPKAIPCRIKEEVLQRDTVVYHAAEAIVCRFYPLSLPQICDASKATAAVAVAVTVVTETGLRGLVRALDTATGGGAEVGEV
jgi:hypothetical protein